ncbi:hypothetical protein [Natribacillus halophilus]|uniref:Uncharacterized protein n=1 Tax=Natribacillus halophilus TaxID=549003 RepID=A0A1G8MY79_9BACI|nr:hypothetical protein [Natribacillus halophilus]SDI72844.1 hypothetical protein SAMN04488123_10598 [Natribacillus halophilus]
MEAEGRDWKRERLLRVVSPSLYQHVTIELESTHNVHSYDIEATAISEEHELELIIRYGDDFNHEERHSFSHQAIEQMDTTITDFIHAVGKNCVKVMVSDYFQRMKP